MQQKLTEMKETRLLLLIAMCSMVNFTTLLAQKTPSFKCSTGEIKLEGERENATCGFVTGRVEICENSTWKTICDRDWTVNDVKVACRELGYIDRGAEEFNVTLSVTDANRISSSVPVCSGTEHNLSACDKQTIQSAVSCSSMNIATIRCYQNDSVVSLCSGNSLSTTTGIIDTTDTSYSTPPSASDFTTTNPLQVSTTTTTTTKNTDSQTQSFLQTPLGLGVVCATIVIIVIVIFITFLIVLLVVYKRSRVNKLESSQVSPQNGNPDDSLITTGTCVHKQQQALVYTNNNSLFCSAQHSCRRDPPDKPLSDKVQSAPAQTYEMVDVAYEEIGGTRPLKVNYDYTQNQAYVVTTAPVRGEGVVNTGGSGNPTYETVDVTYEKIGGTRPLKVNYDYTQNQAYVVTTAPVRGEGVVNTGGSVNPTYEMVDVTYEEIGGTRPLKVNYDYTQNQAYVVTTAPVRGEGVVNTGGSGNPTEVSPVGGDESMIYEN